MTVVDEKSRVPPVDEASLAALARAFDVDGVVSAMLIGSQARGTAGPLSDIDIAFWHRPDLDPKVRLDLRLRLTSAAIAELGTNEVDVVPLNHASPLFRHRAIGEGVQFVERNPKTRVRLEARAIIEYLDTAPLRATLSRGLRKRLKEGDFGRRP